MTAVNVDDTGGLLIPSLSERRKAVLAGRRADGARIGVDSEPGRIFYAILLSVTVLSKRSFEVSEFTLSASSIVSVNNGGSAFTMFLKQLMWAFFGIIIAFGTYRMPYHVWQKLNRPMLAVVLALNCLPFTSLGITVNGARAWVEMGIIRFQPSELLKFALVIYMTNVLGRRQRELTDFKRTFRPAMLAWLGAAGIAMTVKMKSLWANGT